MKKLIKRRISTYGVPKTDYLGIWDSKQSNPSHLIKYNSAFHIQKHE